MRRKLEFFPPTTLQLTGVDELDFENRFRIGQGFESAASRQGETNPPVWISCRATDRSLRDQKPRFRHPHGDHRYRTRSSRRGKCLYRLSNFLATTIGRFPFRVAVDKEHVRREELGGGGDPIGEPARRPGQSLQIRRLPDPIMGSVVLPEHPSEDRDENAIGAAVRQ